MRLSAFKQKPHRGFTLMELVLVLGLLGLLAGLTAPALGGIRAWLAGRESQLLFLEVESACRLYRMENGAWPEPFTAGEIGLNDRPAAWKDFLASYMEREVHGPQLEDGHGNSEIRLVLDTDGDHWIYGRELTRLPESERPERLWARVAIYSLNPDGSLSATNW
jgi:prepilin-type N-terminal cleavage/methylation domain-containing protein